MDQEKRRDCVCSSLHQRGYGVTSLTPDLNRNLITRLTGKRPKNLQYLFKLRKNEQSHPPFLILLRKYLLRMKLLYIVLQIPCGFWATEDKSLETDCISHVQSSGEDKIGLLLSVDGQEGSCLIPIYSWKRGVY